MKNINFRGSQQGSVLIVVLIMLVLLTLVGTWAIRGSITSLKISTNAQAQALLKQTSDSVFFTLENKTDDELVFTNMRIGDGMLNYTLRPENKGKELVFCIRGETKDNFAGSRLASVVYWDGTTIKNTDMGTNGYCQVGRLTDFLSGRNAVLTQVTVRAAENNQDWEHLMEGDDKESSKGTGIQKVTITATSILPNLSDSSKSDINKCLKNYTSFVDNVIKNETVTDCLSSKNVPYSTQEMEYTMKAVRAS
ncbi:pilus assembly PilX N-terminal domain-containing protein [Acinetobacter sp. AG3]|jgi:type II secretory pathway pseudopilin PulG|uniref:pilus assembly PilX family protein n=1 Tax=unclassified Acinetobacter TaxID=196816 RepID=UPI001EF04C9B|nr:pilus assembly PilX N-terminal domain-containing protein [Acinetobacter sp. AG3]MCG7222647.1 pilus assembly PilX N-terminal domain-containing protein [Acinetobacter sp. AG3]